MIPKSATIIVVEDELGARETLSGILEDVGYKVIGLERGTDALEAIRKNGFDAIITDMRLPDVDGMEILELAKETNPDVAVIIMTGYASVETAVDAINEGAYAYFVKPVDPEALKTTLANAIRQQRLLSENRELVDRLQRTNEQLTLMVKRLEEQNQRNSIFAEMRDMLQACSKIDEIHPIIKGSMQKLLPEAKGALFLLSNSRSDLESVATWGDFACDVDENVFPLESCWGLRRGCAHVVEDIAIGPTCPHLKHTPPTSYVCLPLIAKGDILGLLHLQSRQSVNSMEQQKDIADLREIAATLPGYLSLAVANVKLSESLAKQSILDQLSGLFNRRFMEESLQREILRAKRRQTQIGIIMADLDNFKNFNDVYGHAAGDKIIQQIGRLFKGKTRGSDIACRYGGEEFVLVLPESSADNTLGRANDLREEVKNLEVTFEGQILGTITISMGIALYPDQGNELDELLRMADTALYKAKQAGRDRVIG